MARRRTSFFEDVIEPTSRVPWWVGVVLAILAYMILHAVASREIAPATDMRDMGNMAAAQIFKSLAFFGQYLLSGAFLLGALVSAFKRRKRNRLVEGAPVSAKQGAVLNMDWHEFEMLVGEVFRRKGYSVAETGGNGPDGGVDLVLKRGSETFLVQCKHWRANRVGVSIVRELYGVMSAKGAAGGFVVTSGEYTQDAIDFAKGRNIELIAGDRLATLIASVKTTQAASAAPKQAAAVSSSPACPRCGGTMVRRVAKQGANAGKSFWGCTDFPKCRGIVPIGK